MPFFPTISGIEFGRVGNFMANLAISSHQCIPQNLSRMAVALPKRLNEFTGRAPSLAEQLVDLAA
jgi:hypothetical protein